MNRRMARENRVLVFIEKMITRQSMDASNEKDLIIHAITEKLARG